MINTSYDVLEPSKSIVHCKLNRLTYTIEKLRQIGYRILVSELINSEHVYLVADKQFKRIEGRK